MVEALHYEAPSITELGSVSRLTGAKEVGFADGEDFLGIDIGNVS